MDHPTRYDLFAVAAGLVSLRYKYSTIAEKSHPLGRLLSIEPIGVIDICDRIVKAGSTAELLFYYSVFFEPYLHEHGLRTVAELQNTVGLRAVRERYQHDHHRLEALPGIAAAHLLGTASTKSQAEQLDDTLRAGMASEERQTLEMIVQNLTTSMIANPDTRRFFRISPELLGCIHRLLRRCLNSRHYFFPLCNTLLFLLNLRLLYMDRKEPIHQINSILAEITSRPTPSWCWMARTLITVHQQTFKSSIGAPPGLTESTLMRSIPPNQTTYYTVVGLAQVLSLHDQYLTAQGKRRYDNYSTEVARRAYSKTGARLKFFDIPQRFIKGLATMPLPDREFRSFLAGEMDELFAKDAGIDEFRPDETEVQFAAYAPFSNLSDKEIALAQGPRRAKLITERVLREVERSDCRNPEALAAALQSADGLIWGTAARPDLSREQLPSNIAKDQILGELEAFCHRLKRALDAEEDRLGPFQWDSNPTGRRSGSMESLPNPQVTADELRSATRLVEELENVLGSEGFIRSKVCSNFLRLVCKAAIERTPLSQKELAVLFGQQEKRIGKIAERTRALLGAYYDDRPESGFRIELPKGSYYPLVRQIDCSGAKGTLRPDEPPIPV
jgi:hypothetical protein